MSKCIQVKPGKLLKFCCKPSSTALSQSNIASSSLVDVNAHLLALHLLTSLPLLIVVA